MGNPLTVDFAPGTQIPLALFMGVPLNVIVGTPGGAVDASAVTYTPANPADWTIPPPSDVATALDQLANVRAFFQTNAGVLPAALTQTLTLGPISAEKSGIYLVWAACELNGTGPNAGVAELSVTMDAVPQGQPQGLGYTVGARTVGLATMALVPTNRAVAHTWTLQASTGTADTMGVAVGRAKLFILEL